ncbi:MAG: hypothetical protein HQL16_03800 [Candidatus Omnitrophica bacterium]|nr:hypothetical protein [Candidatus Omnitrophota bacterium]
MLKKEKEIFEKVSRLLSHFRRFDKRYQGIKLPLKTWQDFRAVSIVSKEDLRGYSVCKPFNITATSGSTATRLLIAHSRGCYQAHIHRLVTLYQSVGISQDDLCLNLCSYSLNSGGRMMEAAYKAAGAGVIPLGVLDSGAKTREAVDFVRELRPTVVNSYTNQLFDFFSLLGRRHSIRMAIVNGEPLTKPFKARIEAMSGVKVYNHYGAMEFSGFAVAQKHTDEYMKVFDNGLFIEVLRDDGTVSSTGEGAVLITDLGNTSMPFIRYKLGDKVEVRARRDGMYVKVLGRLADSVLIDGEVYSISEIAAQGQKGLKHPHFFFVINKDQGTYADKVILNLPGSDMPRFNEIKSLFKKSFSFGNSLDIRSYQGEFPKTTTGKFRHVIDSRKNSEKA